MRATWLADVLRNAGCKVNERPGWKDRGKEFLSFEGVICHHTGAGSSAGLIELVEKGRSDLPGPLSQLFLDEDGTFTVIAAGRSNHAGKGKWQGVTAGNSRMIGIEAKNKGDGTDIWEITQMEAYAKGVAAILKHIKKDAVMAAGHKEYALPKGRKVDPTFDMFAFRLHVENHMRFDVLPINVAPPATVDPVRAMLKKGDMGSSVRQLQKLLGVTVDGNFGPKTESAVIAFQIKHGLVGDGKVGPKTWAVLLQK